MLQWGKTMVLWEEILYFGKNTMTMELDYQKL